jgi:hypothetical protein
MILLTVSHFVGQDKGHFIFVVVERRKEADIDTHIMADRAERVKARIVIDKIIVGLFQDRWIALGDGGRQAVHDPRRHGIGCRIRIDAVLFLDLVHIGVTAFVIQIAKLLVQLDVVRTG